MTSSASGRTDPTDRIERRRARQLTRVALQVHARGDDLLYFDSVQARTGLSRSKLYALIAEDRFPKPVKIGCRSSRWRARDVEAWLSDRDMGRESATLDQLRGA